MPRRVGAITLTNFPSANRVRELAREGLSELWHDLDTLGEPAARWSRPDELVVLAPHGLLHYLPLLALGTGGTALIERNPVSYAGAAAVLRSCRADARRCSVRR